MNVGQLMRFLAQQDPEAEVYLSKDEEGNGFNLLGGWNTTSIIVDGECYDSEDEEFEDCVPEGHEDDPRAVILWP